MNTRPTLTVDKKDYDWMRERFPTWDVRVKPRGSWIDIPLLWVAVFGVWPLLDPGHDLDTAWSVVDIVLHCAAIAWLVVRWKVVRR